MFSENNISYIDIGNRLEKEGYVVVQGDKDHAFDTTELGLNFERYCSNIATPMPHDSEGKIVWDIKSKAEGMDGEKVVTFSEHSDEAVLHTDSQYVDKPEDYFSLFCIKKADCGGGLSILLSVSDILKELEETEKGRAAKQILETTEYPFIVPNVFKKDKSKKHEFTFGKIITGDTMRFRVDTIEKAIHQNAGFCSDEQVEAFSILKDIIQNSRYTKRLMLEDNEAIFINNKTMLHGRTAFSDSKRHLLRIRMNIKTSV